MRVGIVNPETWDFMHDLHAVIRERSECHVFAYTPVRSPIFRERLDRHVLKRSLTAFLRTNDVVFFEWASGLLAKATHMPKTCAIVARLHRYELYAWADRINWDSVDGVIVVSEVKRQAFIDRFPAQASKVHVVPVGVSPGRFGFAPKAFSGALGTLCHLTPRKRVYDLILALSALLQGTEHLHLFVGGDPHPAHMDYYEALMRLVRHLGLESKVIFDGPVSRPEEWYPRIDVFLSHSYSEGLQVAPMEAMATGCYTLSHHWDGAEELLPPDCLYMSNDGLERRLKAFCRLSEEERRCQRQRMRRIVEERFDAARSSRRIFEIIESCAPRRGASAVVASSEAYQSTGTSN
jgi:glycosyltransferase involved in cell wall biosynthesis